ncbi:MAG: class I SAM-dependent methyltransferase [Anaerolineae bacterium]|nr:class I SAM-dependent methyltransferase [Anaerolineae bacterium]
MPDRDLPTPRLVSILAQISLPAAPRTVLNIGCGVFPASRALDAVLPGWTCTGIDLDFYALRRARQAAPGLHPVCADATYLPGLFHTRFALILIRHPDVFQHRKTWSRVIPILPNIIAPGGAALITLYTPEEVSLVYTMAPNTIQPVDEQCLARVTLTGHDRYPLIYRRDGVAAKTPGSC